MAAAESLLAPTAAEPQALPTAVGPQASPTAVGPQASPTAVGPLASPTTAALLAALPAVVRVGRPVAAARVAALALSRIAPTASTTIVIWQHRLRRHGLRCRLQLRAAHARWRVGRPALVLAGLRAATRLHERRRLPDRGDQRRDRDQRNSCARLLLVRVRRAAGGLVSDRYSGLFQRWYLFWTDGKSDRRSRGVHPVRLVDVRPCRRALAGCARSGGRVRAEVEWHGSLPASALGHPDPRLRRCSAGRRRLRGRHLRG